ncbi:MAG: DEAD/DEAH box helicase family protein [Cellulosilyticaceae bacterium]
MGENQELKLETIALANAITGESNHLYNRLKYSMAQAERMDIIVSFLMESGVKLILRDLEAAVARGVKVRILTGNYLNITQPSALYLIRDKFGDQVDLRFYNVPNKSFHPKSYMFHHAQGSELYIGSSNVSRGALTSSVEWNYRLIREGNEVDFDYFTNTFEDLFERHSEIVTEEVLKNYSKNWSKPKLLTQMEATEESVVVPLFEPRGAQIEALYALKQSREEGAEKALVVAATGIGKTYLAAFDSLEYDRILFVAHRDEILKQAATSFRNVRKSEDIGFFQGNKKEMDKAMTFALVQTLGKDEYLKPEYFKPDEFDYLIIDEFHHAASDKYKNVINYFKPKFMLGLTATPERLDNKDVFALCDYNMVYEVRLKEAINKGWLVPFRYYGIYDDTVDYEKIQIKTNGQYDARQLEEELMIHKRAEFILKHYQKYNSKRAMGFCTSKAHADFMAKYFSDNGIAAAAVFSGEKGEATEERDIALAKLQSGDLQVLFSVDMFNEGIDVPAIDMVLFLRPTESPTIFLQQLGRGLRKYKDKMYLNVLDFIGNYKKANLVPFLLSGKPYDKVASVKGSPLKLEFPEDCHIDFDFRLIDLFKIQAQREMTVKDLVKQEYLRVKEEVKHVPSRVELFLGMDSDVYDSIKSKSKINIFNDYMSFLSEMGELDQEEEQLMGSRGREFILNLETTQMQKLYKIPLLRTFYNEGHIKLKVTEDEALGIFKEFYSHLANLRDLKDCKSWSDKKWLSQIKSNPVKAFLNSANNFFAEEEGYLLTIKGELKEIVETDVFAKHLEDVIEFKKLVFYQERLDKSN